MTHDLDLAQSDQDQQLTNYSHA